MAEESAGEKNGPSTYIHTMARVQPLAYLRLIPVDWDC